MDIIELKFKIVFLQWQDRAENVINFRKIGNVNILNFPSGLDTITIHPFSVFPAIHVHYKPKNIFGAILFLNVKYWAQIIKSNTILKIDRLKILSKPFCSENNFTYSILRE